MCIKNLLYAFVVAAAAIIQYPDMIPDDPFGETLSKIHVLVVYVILIFCLMLILISVVSPNRPIFTTSLLKKLALIGLSLIAAAVAIEAF
ncbi:hypothetical protein MRB53_020690 [Persea americana]|uniref:Uncharacterized protein n=1 Tax=Persea americana TaxID=3435 RepID=A0ACC2L295_PERAE|nr:hypothetical protein MRB53_020690 [Persea americana]